jgi:hypothetical protein
MVGENHIIRSFKILTVPGILLEFESRIRWTIHVASIWEMRNA